MSDELNKYLSGLSETARKGSYFIFAKKFDSFAGENYSKITVQNFIKKLRERDKEGRVYADGTIDFAFRVVRRFFKVNNIPWEFGRLEGPIIRQDEVRQVALEPKLVEQMIMVAKDSKLTPAEGAFLALGTTYGLRREELADLTNDDIDLKHKTLFVQTIKHGRQRYHLIPEEIMPYIKVELPVLTVGQLTSIFHSIEEKSYGKHIPEAGFHSLRRGLTTALADAGLSEVVINSFMRWKAGSSMINRYYVTRYTGLNGERIALGKGTEEMDRVVFEVHPWLHIWGKK